MRALSAEATERLDRSELERMQAPLAEEASLAHHALERREAVRMTVPAEREGHLAAQLVAALAVVEERRGEAAHRRAARAPAESVGRGLCRVWRAAQRLGEPADRALRA